jgi:sulfur relay (sulfurtransferase) complex TusBCD TusD component (DsrE family)
MGNLLIILSETPFHSDKVEKALRIAEVAIKKTHDVSIFLFMDGVYNILNTQDGSPFKLMPIYKRIQELMDSGATIYSCKLCKILRGIEDNSIPDGIVVGGIAELNDLIGEADSIISFIG